MAVRDTPARVSQAIRDIVRRQFVATVRAAVDPAAVAAEASGDTTVACVGALLGDFVEWAFETDVLTGVNAQIVCFVSAADTITVHVSNGNAAAGAAIDIASQTWQFVVSRRMVSN